MENLNKIALLIAVIGFISNAAAAQHTPPQNHLRALSPEYKQKLENRFNEGLRIKPDSLQALPPHLNSDFYQYYHSRIPGMENMPNYNPAPLSQWRMPSIKIDSTTHYHIEKKMIPRYRENPPDFQYKGKEIPQKSNPEQRN